MWDVKAKVIPVVMGALGSVPMVIDVEISVKLIQKCAYIHTYIHTYFIDFPKGLFKDNT